jgi:hypothetical protein
MDGLVIDKLLIMRREAQALRAGQLDTPLEREE